jgi:hypothetical protein
MPSSVGNLIIIDSQRRVGMVAGGGGGATLGGCKKLKGPMLHKFGVFKLWTCYYYNYNNLGFHLSEVYSL